MMMRRMIMIMIMIIIMIIRQSSPPSRSCPTPAHPTAPTPCFPTRHWPCRCLTIYDLWSVMVAVLLNEQSVTAQCNMIIWIMIDEKIWNETAPGQSQNHCWHGVYNQLYLSTAGKSLIKYWFQIFLIRKSQFGTGLSLRVFWNVGWSFATNGNYRICYSFFTFAIIREAH